MNNLETLIKISGQQGGTIHQVKDYYMVTVKSIIDLDTNWLQAIYNSMLDGSIAAPKTISLAKKYYQIPNVNLVQITELIIRLKLHGKI